MRISSAIAMLLAAGCALAFTGCSSDAPHLPVAAGAPQWAGLTPAERAQRVHDYDARLQNGVAACMKQKGFTYVPVIRTTTDSENDPDSYTALQAERSKYGFFIFAPYALPDDPQVKQRTAPPSTHADDPNIAILAALPADQHAAYTKALQGEPTASSASASGTAGPGATTTRAPGCLTTGTLAAGPDPRPTLTTTQMAQVQHMFRSGIQKALDSYAACLKTKGYSVPADPQQMLSTVYGTEAAKLEGLKKQGPLNLSTAQTALTGEIAAALTDLDCGKSWYQLHDEEVLAMHPELAPS
jgi:hypothetical protein